MKTIVCTGHFLALTIASICADGIVRPPIAYKGSLEEKSQEAIIVFREGDGTKSAVEDLILKIRVEGTADSFGWIVPFPNPPKTSKADPKLFEELHRYVQERRHRYGSKGWPKGATVPAAFADNKSGVAVISRKVVGSYDVAIVRELRKGSLQGWLAQEKFQPLEGGDKLIDWYRKKNYVFACMKVSDVKRARGVKTADLHPLRFRFATGGRDGIYFPMRMTGLQKDGFDINLHVFYRAWLNDRINKHGYQYQGFRLNHRDWDTRECKPNAGKDWSNPARDPYLRGLRDTFPTVTKYFREHHKGARFYLTNIQGSFSPENVLDTRRDLWLFPHYTDRRFVPFDKRRGGVAQ